MENPIATLNQPAPDFSLPDLTGILWSPSNVRGRVLVLNFWSADCPWSARTDTEALASLAHWGESVAWWSIASNANEPPDLLAAASQERGLAPVLLDSGARVAGLYGAQTTPHLFVIDPAGLLRYTGAFDDVTFRRRAPTRAYLVEAVDALLAGNLPDPAETPPYGCTVVHWDEYTGSPFP